MTDRVYLGLGSNLGDRLAHLRRALDAVNQLPATRVLATSAIYETQPRFFTSQPDFLNACARIETALPPIDLLQALQRIEADLGRERLMPNGPRTVDLDLLLYDDQLIDAPTLKLPHPGLHQRAFVLVPLIEVMGAHASTLLHPRLTRSFTDLLTTCPDAGWVRPYSPDTASA